jgi:single-strand DNA-binding protein
LKRHRLCPPTIHTTFTTKHKDKEFIMTGYNKVILMGHLTRDPEVKTLPDSNTTVCNFALAVNRTWKDAEGNAREEVLFMDCAAFGRTADTIGQYLAKGRPIHVEGRLKLERWEQDGQSRSKVRVIVEQFRFVDSGRPDTNGSAAHAGNGNGRAGNARIPAKTNGKATQPARGRRPAKARSASGDNSPTFASAASATATAEADPHGTDGDGIPF